MQILLSNSVQRNTGATLFSSCNASEKGNLFRVINYDAKQALYVVGYEE